ncbi:hypothetical protein L8V01_02865 [Corynebacterium sp. c8Ua_181]|uniref:Transposase n=1 Tax=Corynebacterium curieae TaxID=2913500 RepID=A0A9X3RSW5_9CORY|nr:hypothetical protein [Corynebacterium curieae]MCZ9306426.1 hypothetical protein [Corynebacterium curieae]MDV2424005.1 hypothetical protein [Corynebacterium curieae]
MNQTPFSNDDVAKRALEVINSLSTELSNTYKNLATEADRSDRLLDSIEKQQKEISFLKQRVETLESTKALKLQRRYWKLRKGLPFGKGKYA